MYILVISKYGLGERASSLINRKVVFGNKRPLLHSDGKEIFKFQYKGMYSTLLNVFLATCFFRVFLAKQRPWDTGVLLKKRDGAKY